MPLVFLPPRSLMNPKSLNNFYWSSSLIPAPVSLTLISRILTYISLTFSSKTVCQYILEEMITEPLSVNFKALDYKFNKIY